MQKEMMEKKEHTVHSSLLLSIQDTVQKYADIMAKIAGIDVEVVDTELYRVAGTGIYEKMINRDMSGEGHVYRHVMNTGEVKVIDRPGYDMLCGECAMRANCREQIEISKPILMEKEIIGVIGLVGSSVEQKDTILQNQEMYLNLLDQIAEFIATKAKDYQETEARTAMLDMLYYTMNHIEQGVLVIGEDDSITLTNKSAKKQLKRDTLEGCHIDVRSTGDNLSGGIEYKLYIEQKETTVYGEIFKLKSPSSEYAKILIFSDNQKLLNRVYEMTNTVTDVGVDHIIGSSESTSKLRREIGKIAKSTSTVLITGESGTGKEVAATAIWKLSDRRDKKFIALNCGAIPEALLEAELFGYVKGAFTGADPNGRIGKFELADKGVLFLDEIGDMPLYLQVKLLRVLQERTIVRIGSNQVVPIDVRIIAATNKNLKEMIEAKKFREDLYYRLNVIPLKLEPLRKRPDDIESLAYYFANRYAGIFKKELKGITRDTMMALRTHTWYGNVRELENTMEFMINMMEDDGILTMETLPLEFEREEQGKSDEDVIRTLRELERVEIEKALERFGTTTDGKKEAAKSLGISLATLYRKMEQNFSN